MPRITFVYPDHEANGISQLIAIAETKGLHAELVFYRTGLDKINYGERSHLDSLPAILAGAFRTYDRSVESVPYAEIAEAVSRTRPDIVGFSCVTDYYQAQLNCARALKHIMPHVVTVFGGVHVSAVPAKVLDRPEVDCVAIGDADISFFELIESGSDGDRGFTLPADPVKGMVFKRNGSCVGAFEEGELADLDDLPFQNRDVWVPYLSREYFSVLHTMTSRGCPYSCSYCHNSTVIARRGRPIIRRRSVDNAIAEIVQAREKFGIQRVEFNDDCFAYDTKWLRAFSERYKTEVDLPFICTATPSTATPEVVGLLKEAGCAYVEMGIQSTTEHIARSVLHRHFKTAQIGAALDRFREAGIGVIADHIMNLPGETARDMDKTILFYNRYRPETLNVFFLAFYPGTPIVTIAAERGLLTEQDVEDVEQGVNTCGGSISEMGTVGRDVKGYFLASAAMLNLLPAMPRKLVAFLVWSRLYRLLRIRNHLVPRLLRQSLQRRSIRRRVADKFSKALARAR